MVVADEFEVVVVSDEVVVLPVGEPVVEPEELPPPCLVHTPGTNSGLYTPTAFLGQALVASMPVS